MGLVVIDDPTSILRCTNKIYLADLFATTGVPAPKTLFLSRDRPEQLEAAAETLGFPIVIKIPDGSFSRGMVKVEDMDELRTKSQPLFKESSLSACAGISVHRLRLAYRYPEQQGAVCVPLLHGERPLADLSPH